jgi:ferritin-like metal-binding protein YciE
MIDKAIPKLVEAANASDLKTALQRHLGETETHVTRLEQIFGMLDQDPNPTFPL